MIWKHKRKLRSRKRKETQKRKRTIIIASALVCAALFIIGTSMLSGWERLSITTVSVNGEEVVDSAQITKHVEEHLQGNYLGLYARANSLLYPRKRITASLYDAFPRLKSVQVRVESLNILYIDVTERDPYALWCGNESNPERTADNESCHFIDNLGFVYADAPSFSGNVFLRFYTPKKGDSILPEHFTETFRLIEALKERDVVPHIFEYNDDSDARIIVTDPFDYESELIIDFQSDPQTLISNLTTLYGELTAVEGAPLPKIEYVDLRFGNRVFYRLENDSAFTESDLPVQ